MTESGAIFFLIVLSLQTFVFPGVADIQEFYETTLLDDSKTSHEKTMETLRIASKWEREAPIVNSQPKTEVHLS